MPRFKNATCKQCGKKFEAYTRTIGGWTQFCSFACFGESRRTRIPRTCQTCGKVFSFAPSQLNRSKTAGRFCSRTCASEGRIADFARKPVTDRYGRTRRKADRDWQKAVRERDNSTCQRCGRYDPYIHTHHIATRRQRPDLKHEVSNGVCLCGSCHQWVHHHPAEAKERGWLSDASYELNSLKLRNINSGLAQRRRVSMNCETCGKRFDVAESKRGIRRFCSHPCYVISRWGHPSAA